MASTRDLESQAETDRSQIAATLEELRSRMSTGQLVDHAMAYARGHGGAELLRNLGDQVKANPLPLALVAAGLGWLMMSRPAATRRTYAPSIVPDDPVGPEGKSLDERFDDLARDTSGEVAGAVRDSTQGATERAGGALAAARDSTRHATSTAFDTMASARDRAENAAGKARDSLSSAYGVATDAVGRATSAVSDTAASIGRQAHDMRDRAADVGHSTSERARQAGHGVAEQAGRAQNAIAQVMREQPLIVGAVGLTIGAIIGASLPRSRKEDEVMGEASDLFKATAAGTAREQFAHLEQAGGRIVEKVRGEAEDHGLTSDSMQALVCDIGAKVSAVAAAAKEAVEEELKSAKTSATAAAESSEEPFAQGGPGEHSEHESEKSQVDEASRVERYSEADPSYLPVGSGQPAGQDKKTTERVG